MERALHPGFSAFDVLGTFAFGEAKAVEACDALVLPRFLLISRTACGPVVGSPTCVSPLGTCYTT